MPIKRIAHRSYNVIRKSASVILFSKKVEDVSLTSYAHEKKPKEFVTLSANLLYQHRMRETLESKPASGYPKRIVP
jgi:hypothetical protein